MKKRFWYTKVLWYASMFLLCTGYLIILGCQSIQHAPAPEVPVTVHANPDAYIPFGDEPDDTIYSYGTNIPEMDIILTPPFPKETEYAAYPYYLNQADHSAAGIAFSAEKGLKIIAPVTGELVYLPLSNPASALFPYGQMILIVHRPTRSVIYMYLFKGKIYPSLNMTVVRRGQVIGSTGEKIPGSDKEYYDGISLYLTMINATGKYFDLTSPGFWSQPVLKSEP